MYFPFGINKESEIYCIASKTPFVLDQMTEWERTSSIGVDFSHGWHFNNEDYPRIVEWVESAVIQSGWSLIDEDGVTWWIGLFIRAYLRVADGEYKHSKYDNIFKQVFIEYFKDK